jgi:2-haloacid dehalogenase
MARPVLAFDVYGTLFDTRGVAAALAEVAGQRAGELAQLWRDKQLEYSFRRGLMGVYEDFTECTRRALDYVCARTGLALEPAQHANLLAAYQRLPAFDDASPALEQLETDGFAIYAFSNGPARAVWELLQSSQLAPYFLDVISVDEVRSFKPDPEVYRHFLRRANCHGSGTWLVSANPFDVIGALTVGWQAAWIRRDPKTIFDPWDLQPSATLRDLTELRALFG